LVTAGSVLGEGLHHPVLVTQGHIRSVGTPDMLRAVRTDRL
jgi:acyl-coenzyme A synthetase/AMP-(fatty) acid ligase